MIEQSFYPNYFFKIEWNHSSPYEFVLRRLDKFDQTYNFYCFFRFKLTIFRLFEVMKNKYKACVTFMVSFKKLQLY